MSALDGPWLPALDPVSGMLVVPIWLIGALGALFVLVGVFAFDRSTASRPVVLGVRYAAILIAGLLAWGALDRSAIRDAAAERRALDARASELTARAITPGSALACLDASTGEGLERACEKALFASPESVAAAVAYVSARLALLADGTKYAKRFDASYARQLAGLQRAAETDRFGIVAFVLATRDGCTAEACATFVLLGDARQVSANLKEGTLEAYVGRHIASWPQGESVATATAPTASTPVTPAPALSRPLAAATPPASAPTGTPVPSTYNFPSAASIPPVSIMTVESPNAAPPLAGTPLLAAPAAPPPGAENPASSRRPPQAAAPPKKQAPPPTRNPQPAGPPATAGNAPPTASGPPRVQ
jgi:hypothetical protein